MVSRLARRVCVAVTVSALFAAFAAADASASYRFFQFNMCGQVSGGECNGGSTEPVATAVKRSIVDLQPHAVSLNEACKAQYDKIRTLLEQDNTTADGDGTWKLAGGEWRQTNFSNDCPNSDFGNAILTRNAITETDSISLAESGAETRKLVCGLTEIASRATRACSVHIDTDPTIAGTQIRQVRDKVNYYIENGKAVVLMGDFNVEPPDYQLDPLYHSQIFADEFGFGRFKEVDQGDPACRCGESTSGTHKYDYIFLSGGHWKIVDGDATSSNYSDHDPLRGWADTQ